MSTFFFGITEIVPSLFRGILSVRNSVPNPSHEGEGGHLDSAQQGHLQLYSPTNESWGHEGEGGQHPTGTPAALFTYQ